VSAILLLSISGVHSACWRLAVVSSMGITLFADLFPRGAQHGINWLWPCWSESA
jgi:hypothetical protein